MKDKNKTYLAIVKVEGKEPEDFYFTAKNSYIVKNVLKNFFKKTLGEHKIIEVETKRMMRIDGNYIIIK